mmetsp:Transcript_93824/g.186100  ORF Transcript_93824/g.186100 Transcript_93824/m.186100 type:complete len:234 (+) Transcript_93824:40-741(+)
MLAPDCVDTQCIIRSRRSQAAAKIAVNSVAGAAAGLAGYLGRAGRKWQDVVVQSCMDDDAGNGVRRRRQIREVPIHVDRPLFGGGADGQERLRELTEALFTLLTLFDRSPSALPGPGMIPRARLTELSLAANSVVAAALMSGGDGQPLPEIPVGDNPCIEYSEFQGYIKSLLSTVSYNGLSQELVLQHLIADVRSGYISAQRCEPAEPEAELGAEPEEEPWVDVNMARHQQAD